MATRKQSRGRQGLWTRATGLLRVVLLSLTLLSATTVLVYREAHAQSAETLMGFGRELMSWAGAQPASGQRSLRLNGGTLHLLTLSFEEDIETVLNRFHADCKKRGGLKTPADAIASLGLETDGVFRQESSEEGVLACLDTGGPSEVEELFERLERFVESGDLNDVGKLRYVIAKKSGASTSALVLWTEGPLPLKQMFPKTGDAPGRDPVGIPRFPGSERLLSASEDSQPYSVTSYRCPEQESVDALQWYRERLEATGWTLSSEGSGVLFAKRGKRTIVINIDKLRDLLNIVELS